MLLKKTSLVSGVLNEMEIPVTQEELDYYENSGRLIQNVFPDLSPAQREFIQTGITPEEWDQFMCEDEEF